MPICPECRTGYEDTLPACPSCHRQNPSRGRPGPIVKSSRLIAGLILINLGIFIATVAWLPRRGSYAYSGPVSRFINSRERWDIPWVVLAGSSLVSTGAVLALRKGRDR